MTHSGSVAATVGARSAMRRGRAATGGAARDADVAFPRDGSTLVNGVPRALLLMEQLIEAFEWRDAGDPDAPPWEADAEIRRLEHELSSVLRATVGWLSRGQEGGDAPW